MSNRAFGDADFIDASRQFVCVRPDTYENEENQKLVRSMLRGKLENTAFCILSPDGTKQLSQTGRGVTSDVRNANGLDVFALQFRPKGDWNDAFTPDFDTFRMALNIASADSRLLVVVVAADEKKVAAEKRMRQVAWNDDIVGRFHFDFVSNANAIVKPLSLNSNAREGIYFVRPGEFGTNGTVVKQLPLNADSSKVISALQAANADYARTTKPKKYGDHVATGRKEGYYFEMKMPFGEDRDADGKPDGSPQRMQRAKSKAAAAGKYFPAE